jgi:acyl-CoA thioesterase FadM
MEDKIEKMVITSRGYELASSGVLPMATYLRYLEHIRMTTIVTSEKLPLRQFWQMGVVRSQAVELYEQTSFGATLELTMWLARVGRSSMDFSHDIVRVADGVLLGRSTATIVALDFERRPALVGEGAREYIVDRPGIAPDRFEGDAPPSAWSRTIELRPSDHDLQQHVNHARYAELIDDTRLLCADAGGYGTPGDWTRPVRRFSIAYEQEARVGDAVVGKTWPTPGKAASADFLLSKGTGAIVTRARIEL